MAQVIQDADIKAAVAVLGKDNKVTGPVLSLLARCSSPEERKKVIEEIQKKFLKDFGKVITFNEYQKGKPDSVKQIELWVPTASEKQTLAAIGDKIFKKLIASPTSKVKLDKELQSCNAYINVGELQWVKDYCKKTLNLDIVFTGPKGELCASLKQGLGSLPSIPKAPIPTALKRENQKTAAEKLAEKKAQDEKSYWGKARDSFLDNVAAPAATITTQVVDAVVPESVQKFVSKAAEVVLPPIISVVENVWDFGVAVTEKFFPGAILDNNQKLPEKPQSKSGEPDSITEDGIAVFKVEKVEELATAEPPKKPTATLPPRKPTEKPKVEVAVVPPIPEPAPVTPLPQRPAPSILFSENLPTPTSAPLVVAPTPVAPQIAALNLRSIQPTLEPIAPLKLELPPSPRFNLDLPLTTNKAGFDLLMESLKRSIEQYSASNFSDSQNQSAPNAIAAVIESVRQAPAQLAEARSREAQEEKVEQVKNQVISIVSSPGMPTLYGIEAAQAALLALVGKTSNTEVERIRGMINTARSRLETQQAEAVRRKETQTTFAT